MKIAYAGYVAAYDIDGVNDKIAAQIATWSAMGHDVEFLCLSPPPPAGGREPRLHGAIFPFRGVRARARATIALARAIRRASPDVVYLRYDVFLPPLARCLRPLPVVLEINTDDRRETRLDGWGGWLYNELTRGIMFRAAAGLVCVTQELARSPGVVRYRKPLTVIANAGDAGSIATLPATARRRLAAVMLVGYMAPWAGVDKARTLAKALPDIDVHVVGDVGSQIEPTPANLHLHGLLARSQYRSILEHSDIGIGPLALHRKGMHEASPLKVREYLSHGLPVLLAHDDTDFPGPTPWYLLQIPNDEGNVAAAVADIDTWLRSVAGRRVPRDEVVQRIGLEAKEHARMAFLESVVKLSHSPPHRKRST
jgi:hypothetical protein